jgi:hypothetical protein
MAFYFKLEHKDGTPADTPKFQNRRTRPKHRWFTATGSAPSPMAERPAECERWCSTQERSPR